MYRWNKGFKVFWFVGAVSGIVSPRFIHWRPNQQGDSFEDWAFNEVISAVIGVGLWSNRISALEKAPERAPASTRSQRKGYVGTKQLRAGQGESSHQDSDMGSQGAHFGNPWARALERTFTENNLLSWWRVEMEVPGAKVLGKRMGTEQEVCSWEWHRP